VSYQVESAVEAGQYVQARYRCENQIGYSEYSDADFLLVAGKPLAPPQPQYMASTDTSISIRLFESEFSNGAPIFKYEVWRDSGNHEGDELSV